MNPEPTKDPRSKCHSASVRAVSGDEGTSFYVCTDCKQPCDIYTTKPLHNPCTEPNCSGRCYHLASAPSESKVKVMKVSGESESISFEQQIIEIIEFHHIPTDEVLGDSLAAAILAAHRAAINTARIEAVAEFAERVKGPQGNVIAYSKQQDTAAWGINYMMKRINAEPPNGIVELNRRMTARLAHLREGK